MNNILIGTVREHMPLDLMRGNVQEDLLKNALDGIFSPEEIGKLVGEPNERDLFIYAFSRTAQGRDFIEWILDFTLRAPLRFDSSNMEAMAISAARREALNIPAEMILAAISRGEQAIKARSPGETQ